MRDLKRSPINFIPSNKRLGLDAFPPMLILSYLLSLMTLNSSEIVYYSSAELFCELKYEAIFLFSYCFLFVFNYILEYRSFRVQNNVSKLKGSFNSIFIILSRFCRSSISYEFVPLPSLRNF